jgi:uncharacterized iron-regulated protein
MSHRLPLQSIFSVGLLGLISLMGSGCATRSPQAAVSRATWQPTGAAPIVLADQWLLPSNGERPLSEAELEAAIRWADVVLIGETHDNAADHALHIALLDWLLLRFPEAVASFEQFDRTEQDHLDQFLAGALSEDDFIKATESEKWPDWKVNYQPKLDLLKSARRPGFAANAPRSASGLAYREGWDALQALPEDQKAHFNLPVEAPDDSYQDRFHETISGGKKVDRAMVDSMFRGQLLWDSTMAETILRAAESGSPVVHFAGRFHVEHSEGITLQLLGRRPDLKILTLVSAPNGSSIADIVWTPATTEMTPP